MLNAGTLRSYVEGLQRLERHPGIRRLAGAPQEGRQAHPQLFKADVGLLLEGDELLQDEVFGPATVVVEAADEEQLARALDNLHGQLTATLIGEAEDLAAFAGLVPLLEGKAGRLLFNGYPTGVEVCDAMVHGGPYPATSDARGTSVGTLAIERFLRPLCYQDYPDSLLPDALKNANPLGLLRLVDGGARARPWIEHAWKPGWRITPLALSALRSRPRCATLSGRPLALRSLQQRQQLPVQRLGNRHAVPGAAFARFEASLRGQARALFDDAFEQRLGARQVLLRRGAEHAPRIDGDQQFATVGRRTAALVVGQRLGTGQVADQRTGEQFDHRRQGRALVPAESKHGASQRGAGIGGRLALLVHPQPSGIGLPARSCNWISPRATALVAKSKTNGGPSGRGQPKAIGLVPKIGLRPPAGATQA